MSSKKARKDPDPGLEADAKSVGDGPPSESRLKTRLGAKELSAFLALKATQARIREIVVARLERKAPGWLIDEVMQNASLKAIEAKSPPRSMETAMGWVGTVTARAVMDYFRRNAVDTKWLRRDVEVEELPGDPEDYAGFTPPKWLLTEWLRPRVAGNPRDQETFEMLVYRANTGKTVAQVAADHAMTEGALKSRIHALKTKHEPQWRRRQRMVVLLMLLGAAAVIGLIAWLLSPLKDPPAGTFPATRPFFERVFDDRDLVTHPYPGNPVEPDAGSP